MKLAARDVTEFLKNPNPKISIALFYGPDHGLVQERAQSLFKALVKDPHDPFLSASLTSDDIKSTPSRLSDEIRALSLLGDRKAIKIRHAGEEIAKALEIALDQGPGNLAIVEAGDLSPRSKIRKLCEQHDAAVAIPCYQDEKRDLINVIKETLHQGQATLTPDALSYLCDHLGGDRSLTRSELQKLDLATYGQETITLDDVIDSIGDSSAKTLESLAHAIASYHPKNALDLIQRLLSEGEAPVTIVRALLRHFQKLHIALIAWQSGQTAKEAITSLRPPIFFKQVDAFTQQLIRWAPDQKSDLIEMALLQLNRIERDCKTTGYPDRTLLSQGLLSICHLTRGR